MKKKYIPIGLVLILLIGITIYYFYPRTTTGKVNTVGTSKFTNTILLRAAAVIFQVLM